MPPKGRQRLSPEEIDARRDEYCQRYGVTALPSGLPPFPSGLRETPQHRDWLAVYKAYNRLGRRQRGQCERCAAPVSQGSVFCDEHRTGRGLEKDVAGERCLICGRQRDGRRPGKHPGVHPQCRRLAMLVADAGPETLDRLRSYLWPRDAAVPIRGKRSKP